MSINDLFLECIRAAVLIALLAMLFLRGSFTSLGKHPGWKSLLSGFCLITVATLLDITDEIPGLERFVVIGDTIYEAFLEKLPGYLLGYVLVLIGFYKMIPALNKAEKHEQALSESEKRFRQIFVATPDPVILTSIESWAILDVNPAFIDQSGFSREDVIGKNSIDLGLWARPTQRDEFQSALQRTGLVDNFEADFIVKGNIVRSGLLSAQVVTINDEDCTLIILRDITKIKEAEAALLEIDKTRCEFISTAAHELRTPLATIMGFADLLYNSEEYDLKKQREYLAHIIDKADTLENIIDDLLDLSRIDSGLGLSLNYTYWNVGKNLEKIIARYQIEYPDYHFKAAIPADLGMIHADHGKVLQVLDNLLGNAIKYSSDSGDILIDAHSHNEILTIKVADQGIGMTEEQVARCFEKFYRADTSNTARGGLGLGLSIVRNVVEAHNGQIAIKSTLGQGTVVTLTLPMTCQQTKRS